MPYFANRFGNPHSRSHIYGWDAEEGVEQARKQVAEMIGATAKEVFFTSGATESNNMAVKGIAAFYGDKKRHMITTQTEHKCVLASCRSLEEQGWDITYLPVGQDGLLDVEHVRNAIRPDTAMVSVMFVNNEIGVVQPIEEIGKLCRENKVFFHTDAAQAAGKVEIDVNKMNIDLLSLSSHKVYGPKGVGALFVRRKPRVRVRPIIDGGGQERGMRSGTLPASIVIGFGKACELAVTEMANDHKHIERLSNKMLTALRTRLPHVYLNGHESQRYPGNLNISFSCVEGESLLMALSKTLSVSSGSACTSASLEPSYVLRAIGVDEEAAHTSLRFGIGRFTTDEEVESAIEDVVEHVARLRELSPLWEMKMDGGAEKVVWS